MINLPVVLILAGGRAKRFWPLEEKNLLPFVGKNLLVHHLENLLRLSLKDVIIIASDKVEKYLKENKPKGLNINLVIQEDNYLGTGRAVLLSRSVYEKNFSGRPLLIINCDDIYEEKLIEQALSFWEKRKENLVVGYEVASYLPIGYFKFKNGKISGIVEKPGEGNMPSNLGNMSIHLFNRPENYFSILRDEDKGKLVGDDHYERVLDRFFKIESFNFMTYKGEWNILKYPWHVLDVSDFFLKKISQTIIGRKTKVDKTAKIVGPVVLEENVRVLENAKILGPSFIGRGTIVGNQTLIRESIVGENCILGFGTEIARSYIGKNSWFHTNYIGDSVLGENIAIGAGSVLANLRLDEKSIKTFIKGEKISTGRNKLGAIIGNNVRIGVNSSIMPGVKIGKNSFVGPGVVLKDDLAEGKFCVFEQKFSTGVNKIVAKNERTKGKLHF